MQLKPNTKLWLVAKDGVSETTFQGVLDTCLGAAAAGRGFRVGHDGVQTEIDFAIFTDPREADECWRRIESERRIVNALQNLDTERLEFIADHPEVLVLAH